MSSVRLPRRPAPALHRYGEHPDQRIEVTLPAGTPGPVPVAVLVHGGYWRSRWTADLMQPMAADLARRGYAACNVEYRRPDRHGWAATTADLAASVAALPALAAGGLPLDLRRVALLGHSAGGQLVMRLAADLAADPAGGAAGGAVRQSLTVSLAVSLAGVLDLVAGDERWLGDGAVSAALGGRAGEDPDEYARSSPAARVPIGVPMAVVVGRQDDGDLVDISRSFAEAARAAGDDIEVLEADGDHFAVIDPAAPIWAGVLEVLDRRV